MNAAQERERETETEMRQTCWIFIVGRKREESSPAALPEFPWESRWDCNPRVSTPAKQALIPPETSGIWNNTIHIEASLPPECPLVDPGTPLEGIVDLITRAFAEVHEVKQAFPQRNPVN